MMRYRVAWIALIFLICLVPSVAQDTLSATVIGDPLYNRDTNTVTLDLVVQGEASLELTNLAPVNFEIGEPVSNLVVTADYQLPIALAIVVDMSFGSDADLIKNTLRSFFLNYYQPDDDVTMYILDGKTDAPRVVIIDSLETAIQVIDSLDQQEPFYFITDAVRQALTDLTNKGSSPVRPRMGLHVSSLITRPDDVTASIGFARENMPYYVVQAHRLRNQQAPLFRQLANNGNGLYSNNQNSVFVLTETDYQSVNTLKILFDTINNSRLVYHISYKTLNQSLLETQAVPLIVRLNDLLVATTNFSYNRTFDAPQIDFANLADLTVNRVPFRDEDGKIAFSRNTQSISVNASYPDGVNRDLVSIRLEVIDAGTDNILQSTLISDLTPTIDDTYVLTWNLDDFSTPDTSRDLTVKVTAFDALGLTAFSERPATISVASAPPLPTSTPVPTATPTAIPENIEPTPIIAPPVNTASTNTVVGQNATSDPNTTLYVIAIFVLVLVAIVLLFRVLRFWRDGGIQLIQYTPDGEMIMMPMAREDIVPNNLDDMPTPTPDELDAMDMMEEQTVLAQLIVTKGFDSAIFESRIIPITDEEFLIGRSEDGECDLVINVPYISPRHCVIVIGENHQYTIRDLNSKNGTFVNDERIPEEEGMPAPIGSEISITKSITMEIWEAEMVLDTTRFDRDGDGDDDAMDEIEEAEFQPLPGLKYAEDDRGSIGDDYEPI
jgi:hypothetical protein